MVQMPVLKGDFLFREGEKVYINRSDELKEYCNLIHKHNFIEIAYVAKGEGVHVVGENKYETKQGDLYIVNFDVSHGFFAKEAGANDPITYNCVFMPEFLDSSLFSLSQFEDISTSFLFKSIFPDETIHHPDIKLSGSLLSDIDSLFRKMHLEYKQMEKGYTEIIRAYLIELIIKIFRSMDSVQPSKNTQKYKLIQKSIEYIKQNYNKEISLSDVAMNSFISKNYFSKLFKEISGINFSDYVQYLRITEACTLLKDTDMKVTDIAFQVGFNDVKFFYEVFKKIVGKTPGDYR